MIGVISEIVASLVDVQSCQEPLIDFPAETFLSTSIGQSADHLFTFHPAGTWQYLVTNVSNAYLIPLLLLSSPELQPG
jgi:hypothetical protein